MSIDPIDSDDPTELRAEILRLRDLVIGAEARNGVLHGRIAELEHTAHQHADLGTAYDNLDAELHRVTSTKWWRARHVVAGTARRILRR